MKISEISNIFSCPKHPKTHTLLYKILIFILIFSSGMGDVGAIGGIKPSYIAAVAVIAVFLVEKIKSFGFTKNKYYIAFSLFALFWGLYAFVQGAFVRDASIWFMFLRFLATNVFLLLIILDYVREASDVDFLLDCFTVYIAVCLIIGFFEIFGDLHIVNIRDTSRWLPHSFYGNENDNAAVLLFGVIAILISIFRSKSTVKRIVLGVLLAVSVYQITATDSRAAILSLIVLVLTSAVFVLLSLIARRSKKAYFIILGSAITLFVVGVVTVMLNFTLTEFIELFTTDGDRESDMQRAELLVAGVRAIFESYGFGLGAGQSILLQNINMHNFYLEIFADYGIFIGVLFCLFLLGISFDLKGTLGDVKHNIFVDGIIRSMPIVMVIAGIGPSSAFKLRGTWIIIGIVFALKYVYAPGICRQENTPRQNNEL